MGFDLSGKGNPEAYFRNSVWYWRPLWRYCEHVAPHIASKVRYGQSNDGDGLNESDSLALANALEKEVLAGNTAKIAKAYQETLDAIPDIPCNICNGTGQRKWHAGTDPTWIKHCNGCNACMGTGKVRPSETYYPFEEENVKDFIKFLRVCKGFEIW